MELQMKFNIKTLLIILFYLLLGILGLYSPLILFLFPIVNIPMAYYMIKSKCSIAHAVGINAIIGIILWIIMGNSTYGVIYLVCIGGIPYLIRYYYEEQYEIPYIVLYIGTIVIGFFLACTISLTVFGVDVMASFMGLLEEYQVIMLNQVDYILQANTQLIEQGNLLKQMVNLQVELMKLLYPAICLVMMWGAVAINIIVLTIVTKIRKVAFLSIRQIGHFKFSRQLMLLLILGMICTQLDSGVSFSVGANIIFIVIMLLEVVGFITVIVGIKRIKGPVIIKMGIGFLSLALFSMLPAALIMVGMFDTLLDLKKADIIV